MRCTRNKRCKRMLKQQNLTLLKKQNILTSYQHSLIGKTLYVVLSAHIRITHSHHSGSNPLVDTKGL